jgi:hypothetical protein
LSSTPHPRIPLVVVGGRGAEGGLGFFMETILNSKIKFKKGTGLKGTVQLQTRKMGHP